MSGMTNEGMIDMPGASPAPLLEARGLTVRYGGATALDGVDVEVPRGGALGVVGESGAGKSTLARVLAGLIEADAGEVRFDGEALPRDPRRRTREQRRRIQMVFQNPDSSLNPRHTVRRILAEGMVLHGVVARADREGIERRCVRLLDMVGLPADALDRRPRAFSGGQRQRIAIARALGVEPEVLVADEPTSALDVSVQRGVLDLLAALRRERGLAVVLITHDLGVVADLCDEVAVMRHGRVVCKGATDAFFADPPQGYPRSLLEAARAVAVRR